MDDSSNGRLDAKYSSKIHFGVSMNCFTMQISLSFPYCDSEALKTAVKAR